MKGAFICFYFKASNSPFLSCLLVTFDCRPLPVSSEFDTQKAFLGVENFNHCCVGWGISTMPEWGGEFETCLDGEGNLKPALVGWEIERFQSFQGNTCGFSMYEEV